MREPLTPPLMRSNVFTHIGRKVQAPRPSLSLAGSTCTSIHEVELGQCSRFAKRPFAKGPFGKRTAFCAAAVSARQPKAQNAYSPNQPRTLIKRVWLFCPMREEPPTVLYTVYLGSNGGVVMLRLLLSPWWLPWY